jgi:lysophospholipase L1-like esterase
MTPSDSEPGTSIKEHLKKPWLLAAGVIVVVALIGWMLVAHRRQGDTIEILGDSITVVSSDAIRTALGNNRLNIQAMGGLRSDQLQSAADQAAPARPRQVIINLGTNDVLEGKDIDLFKASLDKLINTFSAAECVHVVTLNTHMITALGSNEAVLTRANDAIDQVIAQHPNTDKIDWNKIVEASNDPTGNQTITVDSIHPNLKGQRLLAHAYADAVNHCGKTS